MSIDICYDCDEAYCDADFGEGDCIEIHMKRLHEEVFICQSCLEKRPEDDEDQDWQAGMAEEEASS